MCINWEHFFPPLCNGRPTPGYSLRNLLANYMMLVTITANVAMASSTIMLHCQVDLVNVSSDRLFHFSMCYMDFINIQGTGE